MAEELKACPFCGQYDFLIEQLDGCSSVVICQGMVDEHSACLARGPIAIQDDDGEEQPGKDAAIREWNARAQLPSQGEEQCKWVRDEDTGAYETKCGTTWHLMDGGEPDEHGQHFCHHCGKKIDDEVEEHE